MRYLTVVAASAVAIAAVAPLSAQDSKAVKTEAGILMKLNHFPSDPEKATLKQIVDDKTATDGEKTVAQALIDVQHTVAAADKPKLEALAKDAKAPESIKTMANVILKLNHTPSAGEKEQLGKIASAK